MPPRAIEATAEAWAAVGDYVVRAREAQGMSQADLCDASGVSQSVVSKVENGRPDNNRVRATTLSRLSAALGRPTGLLESMASGDPIEAVEGRSDADAVAAVVEAIEADPGLSEESRRFLIGMYERERARSRT